MLGHYSPPTVAKRAEVVVVEHVGGITAQMDIDNQIALVLGELRRDQIVLIFAKLRNEHIVGGRGAESMVEERVELVLLRGGALGGALVLGEFLGAEKKRVVLYSSSLSPQGISSHSEKFSEAITYSNFWGLKNNRIFRLKKGALI